MSSLTECQIDWFISFRHHTTSFLGATILGCHNFQYLFNKNGPSFVTVEE